MVTIKDLRVAYQRKQRGKKREDVVVRNFSLNLASGTSLLLVGPSGCGKTTLLRCLAGLQPYTGTITIDGVDMQQLNRAQRARLVAYVPQENTLFAHLSVLENIVQPLVVTRGYQRERATQIARETLAILGMEPFVTCWPDQLSGGQKQRVAIARALSLQTPLILLDEPTSALDGGNTRLLVAFLRERCRQGTTVLIATQDAYLQELLGDRIVQFDGAV